MGSKFQARLAPGDRFRLQTAGAGGWGDPFTRDPEQVADDVREEKISVENARREYGVILSAGRGEVDPEATRAERLRSARSTAPMPNASAVTSSHEAGERECQTPQS
jgi:N-methylhydantoinase B